MEWNTFYFDELLEVEDGPISYVGLRSQHIVYVQNLYALVRDVYYRIIGTIHIYAAVLSVKRMIGKYTSFVYK